MVVVMVVGMMLEVMVVVVGLLKPLVMYQLPHLHKKKCKL
jgi:hypothetical protein